MAVDQATEGAEYLEQATNDNVVVSSATPSVDCDQFGVLKITALAVAITGITVTGTPVDMQRLTIRILSPGAHAVAYGSQFENVGATAPVLTVAGKRHTADFVYDATTAKWGCVYVAVEA